MHLPIDPRAEARRLAEAARLRLPVAVRPAPPLPDGLAAFDDVPCASIPVWRSRDEAAPPRD